MWSFTLNLHSEKREFHWKWVMSVSITKHSDLTTRSDHPRLKSSNFTWYGDLRKIHNFLGICGTCRCRSRKVSGNNCGNKKRDAPAVRVPVPQNDLFIGVASWYALVKDKIPFITLESGYRIISWKKTSYGESSNVSLLGTNRFPFSRGSPGFTVYVSGTS